MGNAAAVWHPERFADFIYAAAADLPGVERPADIARLCDVTPSQLSKWLNGHTQPSAEEAVKLADGLRVPRKDMLKIAGRWYLDDDGGVDTVELPRTVFSDPRIALLNEMCAEDSPVPEADRELLLTLVERVMAPYQHLLGRRRRRSA